MFNTILIVLAVVIGLAYLAKRNGRKQRDTAQTKRRGAM
jgi:hypothetical protein